MHLLCKNHIMISLPSLSCIPLHLEHHTPSLICAYASYRLTQEQGRARGAGGDPGAGTSGGTRARRRAARVP